MTLKVLIFGGLGFIGSNIAIHFAEKTDYKVIVYDNLDSHSGGSLNNILHPENKGITVVHHDILNFDRVVEFVSKVDLIINCAASSSHAYSMREPFFDLDVNTRGVLNILEAIKRFNKSAQFIQMCTTTQYGKLNYVPADEFHSEQPLDIYSANKCVSEKYTLLYAKVFGINATALRISNCFGPRACIVNKELTFNNYFVGLALKDQCITIYGEGNQKRNIIYVQDVVNATKACIDNPKIIGETFLLVSDEHLRLKEIAQRIVHHCKSGSINYIEWPTTSLKTEVGDQIFSNLKLKESTGWIPSYSFEDGLNETISFFKAHKKYYY